MQPAPGYQYILVICDHATRYPEAFPLQSINTPKLISALVQLFSRVGIPEEILTNQGTNFTSRLMGKVTTDGERGQVVVQFVLQMRDRLEKYREEAKLNLNPSTPFCF